MLNISSYLGRVIYAARQHCRRSARSLPVRMTALFALFLPVPLLAEPGVNVDEFRLKAAIMYNFTQYIDWPDNAFDQPDSHFNVCVLGTDPFGESLLAMQKLSVKNRHIVVSYPKTIAEARACHMLYADEPRLTLLGHEAGKVLGDAPVLTLSSSNEAMETGMDIGFVTQAGKIRWTLNLAATRKARLKVSAKLIEIAVDIIGEVK